MLVIEQEWLEWKEHPVTKEFFNMCIKERDTIKEELVLGLYKEREDVAQGIAKCLLDLKEIQYSDFREVNYGK